MQHFFVTPDQVQNDKIYIEGSDVNHIKNVLRMHTGEEVTVNDGNNQSYLCKIEAFQNEQVVLNIVESKTTDSELPSKIYLFQGLPKQDKMELIVQKAVELGVYQVIPVATKRAVGRWQQISESAAKQAGRGYIPEVHSVMSYKEALEYARELDVVLIPYELATGMKATKQVIGSIKKGDSIGVFIGPEGGFEHEEVEQALEIGAKAITLGKRILRTETAGLTTLSLLMFQIED